MSRKYHGVCFVLVSFVQDLVGRKGSALVCRSEKGQFYNRAGNSISQVEAKKNPPSKKLPRKD